MYTSWAGVDISVYYYMSRSVKLPWVTDDAKRYMKSIHARKMRRRVRQILSQFLLDVEQYDIGPLLPVDDELTNPYDVCDYRFYWKSPKARRK